MAVNVLNRVVVVVGLSALSLAGQSVRLDAQSDKSKQEHQKKEKEPKPPKAAKAAKAKEAPQAQNAQQHGQGHLSPQAQQELIRLHEQRVSQYRQHLGQLQHLAQPHGQKLKQQKRTAQVPF